MKEKDLNKYLKQNTWFHGTTLEGWNESCKYGVRVNYNRGNELDYGYGFYLASKYKQAESFILRNISFMFNIPEQLRKPVVIEFELNLEKIMINYKYKVFLHREDDFFEFV